MCFFYLLPTEHSFSLFTNSFKYCSVLLKPEIGPLSLLMKALQMGGVVQYLFVYACSLQDEQFLSSGSLLITLTHSPWYRGEAGGFMPQLQLLVFQTHTVSSECLMLFNSGFKSWTSPLWSTVELRFQNSLSALFHLFLHIHISISLE